MERCLFCKNPKNKCSVCFFADEKEVKEQEQGQDEIKVLSECE